MLRIKFLCVMSSALVGLCPVGLLIGRGVIKGPGCLDGCGV